MPKPYVFFKDQILYFDSDESRIKAVKLKDIPFKAIDEKTLPVEVLMQLMTNLSKENKEEA